MARLDPGASARWVARRAKQAAASLKAEYEAGKQGDDSPIEPIFPTPGEQLAALQRLMSRRSAPTGDVDDPADRPEAPGAGKRDDLNAGDAETDDTDTDDTDTGDTETDDTDAAEVASALRRIDWQQVRAATGERTSDAAAAMRSLAGQVDWAKVQPVAAQVSSALIAAVASGRLPVGGRLGPLVVKALTDHGSLASRVGSSMRRDDADLPPDFRADLADEPGDRAAAERGDGRIAPLPRWGREGER